MSSFFPMKWEAGGGEEEQPAGGEQVEEVWEASSSDDMLVITSSKLRYVYNCACPDTIVNSILKKKKKLLQYRPPVNVESVLLKKTTTTEHSVQLPLYIAYPGTILLRPHIYIISTLILKKDEKQFTQEPCFHTGYAITERRCTSMTLFLQRESIIP